MSITRADLKAFYRHGFYMGFSWDKSLSDPPDDWIDESFESGYKHWREGRKEIKAANSMNPDVLYERWLARKAGAQETLFKTDELPKK